MNNNIESRPDVVEGKKEGKVIIEIGPGLAPSFILSDKLDREIDDGASYVAIDCNLEELKGMEDIGLRERGAAVAGDLNKLPLKDKTANEIWALNVLSGFKNIPEKMPDGTSVTTLGFSKIFKELARVIKDDGRIIIGEIYTPVKGAKEVDLSKYGFDKQVFTGNELKEFLKENDISEEILSEHSECERWGEPFFMVLTKNKAEESEKV
ncbi:methyltransferase domain-containing protein [Candidatus Parcubacteria bacterium]|nr:MAG: methyltransferase domain-containing protein [Candidatus Parcubacteria bacterium]